MKETTTKKYFFHVLLSWTFIILYLAITILCCYLFKLESDSHKELSLLWARKAGKTEALHRFTKNEFRIYELTKSKVSMENGTIDWVSKKIRDDGDFEIWAYYSRSLDDTIDSTSLAFVKAYNERMKELYNQKR
jgi:hypothetical protein